MMNLIYIIWLGTDILLQPRWVSHDPLLRNLVAELGVKNFWVIRKKSTIKICAKQQAQYQHEL